MAEPDDDKYITFRRHDLVEWLGEMSTLDWRERSPDILLSDALSLSLPDAVVIRRQDKFASPCLLTYAAMIGMVGKEHPDAAIQRNLLHIADYFQRQGEVAGDEGWKLPDL